MINKIKQLWDNWIKSIQVSDNKQYIDKIEQLEKEVTNKQIKLLELEEEFEKSNEIIYELSLENDELDKKIEELEHQIEQIHKPKKETKRPKWLKKGVYYYPKRRFVSKNKDFEFEFSDPTWVFDKSNYLYQLLKKNNLLNIKAKNLKTARKIISTVRKGLTYELDKHENWRPVTETLLGKYGDCEDLSIVIASALGMAGWRDDEVFVAMGWYKNGRKKIGHAWVVFKVNGQWFVAESTAPTTTTYLWEKVKDKYLAEWGLMNWKFYGHIDKTYLTNE